MTRRVAVLGAGLQGVCVALELARRGLAVDLYERNALCLGEASSNNEGKIHLGFVYAGDPSLKTARLMAAGALSFQSLLRRWCGGAIDGLPLSSPFHYVVHRDSLIHPDAVAAHLAGVTAFIRESAGGKAIEYFGQDPAMPCRLLPRHTYDGLFDPVTAVAVYRTSEMSIDPQALASVLRGRVAEVPEIRCRFGRKVTSVTGRKGELVVHTADAEGEDGEAYDFVVNASWIGRLALDASFGIAPQEKWTFRFKYFVRVDAPRERPRVSATIILGPFGDIATYDNGASYLSWYPSGLVARSTELQPPEMPSRLTGPAADVLAASIAAGLGTVVPGVERFRLTANDRGEVSGGWIFAWGTTDIDDPASRFHQRCDVGVRAHGNYLTIDTGKLTVAPLFAMEAADLITGRSK